MHITKNAQEQIQALIQEEIQSAPTSASHAPLGLRIAIKAGGCSGLEYHFSLSHSAQAGDEIFDHQGCRIYIDQKSWALLKSPGTVLDYRQEIQNAGFFVHNPQASQSCGCGASFSL